MKIRHITLLFISACCLFLYTAPLHAQEQKTEQQDALHDFLINYRYEPDYCDFIAGFPEEPLISHACENEDDPSTCYDKVSFTKVFELSSTVQIDVICNPSTPDMYAYFTPEIMESTVKAMTKDSVLETFNINTTQSDDYRLSGLVGQGRKGLYDTLYIAQLWISENSIMSVEAELSGEKNPDADQIFAGILSNTGHIRDVESEEYYKEKLETRSKTVEKNK
ncbi:MAG: hypothetical protein KAJ40_08120 [Alphaproteobacteria bacterium]|nr:hypothetical protein [Alphaproteobacteria bacterium]